jgi:hypothetical protein
MAESSEEKKDRLPGSNFLSKLLIRKIKKSKANKESKKFKKNEKKNKKQVDKEAKKAVIRTMPGTTKLEKRLNFAGAKARVRDAERKERRSKKKADREVKRDLRKSGRAVKRATIESMPGTTMLEKRLNFAGAKARARKADREETKRLKKEGPLQYTPTKVAGDFLNKEAKINQQPRKEIKVLETKERDGRSETRKAFDAAFAKARNEKGPGQTFTFRGKEYTTNLKEEENKAKHGASLAIMIAPVKTKKMKTIKKAQKGATVPPSDKKQGGRSERGKAFDAAFAKAIEDGVSTFEFEGKTYDARKEGEIYGDKLTRMVNVARQKYRASDEYKQKRKEEQEWKEKRKFEYSQAFDGDLDPSDYIGNMPGMSFDLDTRQGRINFDEAKKKYNAKQKLKKQLESPPRKNIATRQDNTRVNLPPVKLKHGGSLKEVPSDNKGLSKLPKKVRNKMGYMKHGGKLKDKMMYGGGAMKNAMKKAQNGGKLTNPPEDYGKPMVDKMARLRRAEKNKLQKKAGDNRAKPIRSTTRRVKKINTPSLELRDDRPYSKRPRKDYIPQTVRDKMKAKKAMYGAKMKKKAMYGAKMKKK